MTTSVYTINKSINKPVTFKGLKAQYIWYLGGGVVILLVAYVFLYICGVNTYLCLLLIFGLGTVLCLYVYRLSHKYGEHGMMKRLAQKNIPHAVKSRTRKTFIRLISK